MTSVDMTLPLRFMPAERLTRSLAAVAAVGALATIAGLFVDPGHTWPNLLLASYYGISLSLGGTLFIALQYVTNAGWSVALRRVPEAMAYTLPVFGCLMLLTFLGIPRLYEWSQPAAMAAEHLHHSKSDWLNVPFFVGRAVVYILVWWALAHTLVRLSRRQDANGAIEITEKSRAYAATFLVVFGVTISLASFDWIMSLEPHWYSTIFGVYNFSGLFVGSLAALTLLVIFLRRAGSFREIITDDHLHNLGKLMFAFSTFWMYLWFSQYMLIWYANIPEEVVYFIRREQGSWTVITVLNLLFNWVIPFIVLLPQWTKRNETILLRICVLLLLGRWVDLYWMIVPPFAEGNAHFGIWEIVPIATVVSLFFLLVTKVLSQSSLVPLKDPLLVESIGYHG